MKRVLEDGARRCSRCTEYLPRESFPPDASRKDGISYQCVDCKRETNWISRYNITSSQYAGLLDRQGGVCAICGDPPIEKAFAVDHDHSCCDGRKSCGKCVRGLLCDYCNHMLGRAQDNPARLRAGADYLDRWNDEASNPQ